MSRCAHELERPARIKYLVQFVEIGRVKGRQILGIVHHTGRVGVEAAHTDIVAATVVVLAVEQAIGIGARSAALVEAVVGPSRAAERSINNRRKKKETEKS
jgi:hypothetical protein